MLLIDVLLSETMFSHCDDQNALFMHMAANIHLLVFARASVLFSKNLQFVSLRVEY